MRIALHLVGRQADALEQRGDAVAALAACEPMPWIDQRLGDEVADRHARVERGVGVLEDHLHVAAHRPCISSRPRPGGLRPSMAMSPLPGDQAERAPCRWSTCRSRIRRPAPASRRARSRSRRLRRRARGGAPGAKNAAAHVEADVQVVDHRRRRPAWRPSAASPGCLAGRRRRRGAARRRAARACSRLSRRVRRCRRPCPPRPCGHPA